MTAYRNWSAPLLGLWLATGLAGCDNLLEVKNPNNIKGEDVESPVAAASLANGVLRQVAHGVNATALVYGTATDEFDWVGSRDSWRELEEGRISNGYNEFSDAAFPRMAQARWLADEAIRILEAQQAAGTLVDDENLSRAYLYTAMAYVFIADMYEDFTLPTAKGESVDAVGPANMRSLYDTAISYLNKALPLATDAELRLTITATRARAKFDKAIWDKVGVTPISTGLATDAYGAAADAQAALAAAPSADWKFQFTFSSSTGSSDFGAWVNQRQEMRLGRVYVAPDPTDPTWLDQVVLMDPVANVPAPAVDAIQTDFRDADLNAGVTVVSAREMHLIIAEAALAAGNTVGFQTAINNLRAIDKLSNWTPASTVTATNLLIHSRQANLFLQGRRLADHYRFVVPSPDWAAGSQALTAPGNFLPITVIECLSNTKIGAAKCST